MHKHKNKYDKYISICISMQQNSKTTNYNAKKLHTIVEGLTDKMFYLAFENNILSDIKTLYIFCLTNNAIIYFREHIKKSYHKNYLDSIDKLKNISNRIQYYSSTQISIVLPKFSLNDSTILYIFVNYLKSIEYDKNVIKNIIKFYNIKRLKKPTNIIQKEVDNYLIDDTYIPSINLSHVNILSDYNIIQDNGNSKESDILAYKKYIISLDDMFNNYKNKWLC